MTIAQPRTASKLLETEGLLVRAAGLCLEFTTVRGAIVVLRDIDLIIRENEFVAVLGPSGCGKTSLVKIIAGLLTPTRGTCELRADIIAERGRKLGLIPQRPSLLPWATLEDNALLPLRMAGRANDDCIAERLEQLLELVRLRGFRQAHPHELSGGMQMRASLVRGLLSDPNLLLLDEPFAAIDEANRLRLALETRGLLRSRGCAALLVTHSLQEAALVADRILVLSSRPGRILAEIIPDYGAYPRDKSLLDAPEFHAVSKELRARLWHD